MQLKHLGWSCVLLALSGCPSKLDGPCGGFTCTDTERCAPESLTCVPDLPTVIEAEAPAGVVTTATFVVTGTIKDDDKVTVAEAQLGDEAPKTITLEEDGRFSVTFDTPTSLDSETVAIVIRARDAHSETKKELTVTADVVAPFLLLVRPTVGSVTNLPAVEVAVKASDGSGTLSELSVAGEAEPSPQSGVEVVRMIPVPDTHNGDAIDFVITAADRHGNRATRRVGLVGDRVAPVIRVPQPPGPVAVEPTIDLYFEVEDGSPLQVVVRFGNTTHAPVNYDPNFPYRWRAQLPTPIEEQDEVISIEATDLAGNVTTKSMNVFVDTIVPTMTVSSPIAGSLHGVTAIPTSVTTSADVTRVTVGTVATGTLVELDGGAGNWAGVIPMPAGDYATTSLTFFATDRSGNSVSTDVAVIVDTVPPVIAFTSPTQNQRFNASAFTASQDVTVNWTVTDGDSQAATTTVNGAASTALTTSIASTANDNPAAYSTTVVAADRAGNTATRTVNWSVDRRAPTVTSWTPANGARNVEPWESVISFSERVSGPMATSPALTITGQVAPTNDSWNTAHTTYTLPLTNFKGRVLDVGIAAGLADDHGNPVVAPARRFHLATGFASSTTTIATNVSQFDVSSDNDGVASIAIITTANQLKVFQDTGGQFTEIAVTQPSPAPTAIWLNSANVVNGTTLQSSRRVGLTASSTQTWRYQILDGVQVGSPDQVPFTGAVVSRPPLPNEPSSNTFGTIEGPSYARGPMVRILPNEARGLVAQSNDSFAAYTSTSSQVLWSHYRCRNGFSGYDCQGFGYNASATNPTRLQAAMTPSGNCLVTTWTSGTTRQGVFQPLDPCDFIACSTGNLGLTASIQADLRVAPYGANGENTLLFSYASSATELTVAKMNQACAPGTPGAGTATPVGTMPSPAAHLPVRVGNRPGVLYLLGNTLSLRVF